MTSIKSAIESMPDLVRGRGASKEQVSKAERSLGCQFAEEYKEYLKEFGVAFFDGRELTGIGRPDRVDVVSVTEAARQTYGSAVGDWYVVESLGVDGAVAWQDSDGAVHLQVPGCEPVRQCGSLAEWVTE